MIIMTRAGEPERYEDQITPKFVDKIITNVKECFPQVSILEAFSVLDPSGMFGEPEMFMGYLSTFLDHYSVITVLSPGSRAFHNFQGPTLETHKTSLKCARVLKQVAKG